MNNKFNKISNPINQILKAEPSEREEVKNGAIKTLKLI